ncbi:DedA family protein [Patescibacteria group bacterium]|nr:DedA family protein [Patescibacteria group bacterium]
MLNHLLSGITSFVVNAISSGGYIAIAALMVIESAAVPLPSEVIMPFSGYLAATGRFSLLGVALAGAIGSLIGSLVLYFIGSIGGRPLVEKYGKYILINEADLQRADRFFARYGSFSNFIARVVPIVRTFISFPAGLSKSEIKRFMTGSFAGSFIWSLFLGWIGLVLGQNWQQLRAYFHGLDILVVLLAAVVLVWYIRKHMSLRRID